MPNLHNNVSMVECTLDSISSLNSEAPDTDRLLQVATTEQPPPLISSRTRLRPNPLLAPYTSTTLPDPLIFPNKDAEAKT